MLAPVLPQLGIVLAQVFFVSAVPAEILDRPPTYDTSALGLCLAYLRLSMRRDRRYLARIVLVILLNLLLGLCRYWLFFPRYPRSESFLPSLGYFFRGIPI